MRAIMAATAAVVVALALAGCGLGGGSRPAASLAASPRAAPARRPAAGTTGTASTDTASAAAPAPGTAAGGEAAQLARAQRTHELRTPAPRQRVAGGWRSPEQAVRAFATGYVNWTAATVAARLGALARVSVGQARSAVALAAAQTGRDGELRRGGIANSGTVEAIAPVAGRSHAYAVVTRERTTSSRGDAYQGLAPAWHVAVATVTRTGRGLWVLSGWQPEN